MNVATSGRSGTSAALNGFLTSDSHWLGQPGRAGKGDGRRVGSAQSLATPSAASALSPRGSTAVVDDDGAALLFHVPRQLQFGTFGPCALCCAADKLMA